MMVLACQNRAACHFFNKAPKGAFLFPKIAVSYSLAHWLDKICQAIADFVIKPRSVLLAVTRALLLM